MNNPKLQKSKKKSIKKKSSKEISVRDHSDYKKIPKKMYAIKNVSLFTTNLLWKS
jgi:hypothetical protein